MKYKFINWISIVLWIILSCSFCLQAHEIDPRIKKVGDYIVEKIVERHAENALKTASGQQPNYILDINLEDFNKQFNATNDILEVERKANDLAKLREIWAFEATSINQRVNNLVDKEGKPISYYIVRAGIFNYANLQDLTEISWDKLDFNNSISKADQDYVTRLCDYVYKKSEEKFGQKTNSIYHFAISSFAIKDSQNQLYHFQGLAGGQYTAELQELENYNAELLVGFKEPTANSQMDMFNSFVGKIVSIIDKRDKIETETYIAHLGKDALGKSNVVIQLKGQGLGTDQDKAALEAELSAIASQKVQELGGYNAKKSTAINEKIDDVPQAGEFYVKAMNGAEWVSTIGELGSSVWKNATLPERYWNQDKDYAQSSIHMPALLVGTTDGVMEEVLGLQQLVKLGVEIATISEVRNSLWEAVKEISVESVKDAAIAFYEAKKANYTSNKPYIVQHTISKDAVQVATLLSGVTAIKKGGDLAEGVKETGKKIAKEGREKAFNNTKELVDYISRNRNKIRRVLDTEMGKTYAEKYFKNFVKEGDFEDWYKNTFKKYDLGEPVKFEVHHVIPIKVFEKNKELQDILFWAKKNGKEFDFNGIDNGIPLQKKIAAIELKGHANHPNYDDAMVVKLEKITESKAFDNEGKFDLIKDLIEETKNKLEKEVLLGSKDVNQLIDL